MSVPRISLLSCLVGFLCLITGFGHSAEPDPQQSHKVKEEQQKGKFQEKANLDRIISFWLDCLQGKVRAKDFLALRIRNDFSDQWLKEVYSLDEFQGNKTEAELFFPPLNKRLLEMLRKDRKSNQLFTDGDQGLEERMHKFSLLFSEQEIPETYREIVSEMQQWLDYQYRTTVKPDMIYKDATKSRAYMLLSFIITDMQRKQGFSYDSREYKTLTKLMNDAFEKFDRADVFQSLKDSPQQSLPISLSPLERKLYAYFILSLEHNPIFNNLNKPFEKQALYDLYLNYSTKSRPVLEKNAYENVISSLCQSLNPQAPQGKPLLSSVPHKNKTSGTSASPKAQQYAIDTLITDPFFLRQDPKLSVLLSIEMDNPKIEDLFARLCQATGLAFSKGPGLEKHQPRFGHIELRNARASALMKIIEKTDLVNGRWQKVENGYRLNPNASLSINPMAVDENEFPKSKSSSDILPSSGIKGWVVVINACLLLVVLGLIIKRYVGRKALTDRVSSSK